MARVGSLQNSEAWTLESLYFPSKAGGYPSWLHLFNLPSATELECSTCKHQCMFAFQLYSPKTDDSSYYHRTIFIFVCPEPNCWPGNGKDNFKVFRCQLEKSNPLCDMGTLTTMCNYCGCKGLQCCAKCKTVHYCSKQHQILDWKACHKFNCNAGKDKTPVVKPLTEFQIMMKDEIVLGKAKESKEEKLFEHYHQEHVKKRSWNMAPEHATDEAFVRRLMLYSSIKRYAKLILPAEEVPKQILRYNLGGPPGWGLINQIPSNVPNCEHCGGPRVCEFQILSSTLNRINFVALASSINPNGTLTVFTCKYNCNEGSPYKSEFLWKQDFSFQYEYVNTPPRICEKIKNLGGEMMKLSHLSDEELKKIIDV